MFYPMSKLLPRRQVESVLEVYNSLYDTVNYQFSTGVYCRISLCSKSDSHTPVFESKRKSPKTSKN